MTSSPLVGTWRLVSWESRRADGTLVYPLGKKARGFIIYTDDGYMSVALMGADRKPFVADDLLGGTEDEKARAAETFVSYCGRYEYRGDTVVHHVEVSLFPNWIGRDQERRVEVSGKRMTLQAPPLIIKGIEQTAVLVWERT